MSRNVGTFLGAGLLLFAVGCGKGGATPEATFKDFQAAIKAKDGEKAWNLMAKQSQEQMDQAAKFMSTMLSAGLKELDKLPKEARKAAEEDMVKKSGMSLEEAKNMTGKSMFAFGLKHADKFSKGDDNPEKFAEATLENLKVEGDKATATIKSGAKTTPILFLKEGDSWKLVMPEMKGKAGPG